MWRTPSAEEVGPRQETLESEDGGPPAIGRRVYRVSPTGRRHNTQQTIGLQAEMWPTPQLSDQSGIVDGAAARLSHTAENGERAQLYRRVAEFYTNGDPESWPTARAARGPLYRQRALDGRRALSLEGRAESWPTPRADEREQYNSGDESVALSRRAALWPSPLAADGPKAPDRHARGNPSLPGAARAWRTPRAIYGEHRGMEDRHHLTGQAIEMWGTPQARDWRDAVEPPASVPTDSHLSRQAQRSLIGGPPSSPGGRTSRRPSSRPRLNPKFVSWMMNLPVDWCDPFVPIDRTSYARWETQSCQVVLRSLWSFSTQG